MTVRPEDLTAVRSRDVSATDNDALSWRLEAAQLFLENEANQAFFSGVQSDTQISNGNGKGVLVLRRFPIVSVSQVMIGTIVIDQAADSNSAGWILDTVHGLLHLRGYTFSYGIQNISVTFTYGYVSPPRDIWDISISMVARLYKRDPQQNMSSIGVAGQQTTFTVDSLTKRERDVLNNYRRWL